MRAGKNSKHIKNRFFLITDKVALGDIEIHHKGTDEMWANMKTKPTQEKRFRIMHDHVMGIPEYYDDDIDRRRTHPPFPPKIESEQLSATDGEVLEKAAIFLPAKWPTKKTKNRKTCCFHPE